MPSDTADTSSAEAALAALRDRLRHANDLPDWANRATQPVFGEGAIGAPLLFVGEQPGDEEDIAGRPFVGPAGRLFDRALGQAGVDRSAAYVTNAVKHFKFKPTGKRRLHQTPEAGDITYYRPFLIQEIGLVGPRLVVALGATALRAAAGKVLPVMKTRRQVVQAPEGWPVFGTVHPSFLLRIPNPDAREREFDEFVGDLQMAGEVAGLRPAPRRGR
jgi:DNA polymerase